MIIDDKFVEIREGKIDFRGWKFSYDCTTDCDGYLI